MADKTINQLGAGGTVSGANLVPVWQGALTYKVTASGLVTPFLTTLSGRVTINSGLISTNTTDINILSGRVTTNSGVWQDVNTMKFNTSPTVGPHSEGTVFYDSTKKALTYYNDDADVSVNMGQEVLFRIMNNTGATLQNGAVVTNTTSGLIALADSNFRDKSNLISVVTHSIEDGTMGYATRLGEVGGLDTTAYTVGQTLYLGSSGNMTVTKPDDGGYVTVVGVAKVISASAGIIQVNPVTSTLTVEVTDTNGFPDRTSTTLSFNSGTRVFTIAPTGTDFHYYITGDKYEVASADTVTLSAVEGLHVIYYDGSTLTSVSNPTEAQQDVVIRTKAIVAYIYWDATNSDSNYFADERHGISMSPSTHAYLHFSRGAQYLNGIALGDFVIDAGNAEVDAQFSNTSGFTVDEDLMVNIPANSSPTGLPIYYLDGASNMRRTTQPGFSVKTLDGTSATRLVYNKLSGTTWSLAEVGDRDFVLCHVFAINGYTGEDTIIAVIGQASYATSTAAKAGATTEIASILTGFPIEEVVPIGTVIFQTRSSYGNSVNARVVLTDDNENYVDWRTTELGQGANPTSHANLTNLQLAASGVTWGHIDDQAQIIAGLKTFKDGIAIDGAPALDDYSGTVTSVTVTSNSVGYGAILTISGGGNFVMANATTSAACPCIAIALEAGTGTKQVMLNGFISKTGWTWTKGPIYVNTTNGTMTQTAPSTSANIVQIVGYAFTATKIYFNPDLTTIEVA